MRGLAQVRDVGEIGGKRPTSREGETGCEARQPHAPYRAESLPDPCFDESFGASFATVPDLPLSSPMA